MNLIQAQQRLIQRVNNCHPGHQARVRRSACRELHTYLERNGTPKEQRAAIVRDALDMAELEAVADDDGACPACGEDGGTKCGAVHCEY